MPAKSHFRTTSHPFAEAFTYLPTPALLLDDNGYIIAHSAGISKLLTAGITPATLLSQLLHNVQTELGPVASAWAYAHSVARSTSWAEPPALLPVAVLASGGTAQQWQPTLARIPGNSQHNPHWLATAHATAPAAGPTDILLPQLQAALAHVPGYILVVRGPELLISYASPGVANLLEQPHLLGQPAAAVLPDAAADNVLELLRQVYQTGQPATAQKTTLFNSESDDNPCLFDLTIQPLHDVEPRVSGVVLYGQEAASAPVAAATGELPTMPRLGPIVSVSSAEGVLEYLSPEWYAYTGQLADHFQGLDWVDALHPDDWSAALHELPNLLGQGTPWSWEIRIRRHDGVYHRHLMQMIPVWNDAGRITRWHGTMTDIDEPAPEMPAEPATQPLQALTDELPQLAWVALPDGTPIYANRAATTYLGLDTAQLAEQGWQQLFSEKDLPQLQQLIEASKQSGAGWEYESQLRQPDGRQRWFRHQGWPQQNAAGQLLGWYGFSTDIQASKQPELSPRLQELDTFVRAAATELRQPIQNMQALFDELRKSATFHDPDASALLTMLDSGLKRWNATVRDLTHFLQVQEQNHLPAEELSLASLTREALLGLHPRLRAASGEVSMHFQSLPTVSYVRPHLLSILTHLLSNSLRRHDPARPLRLRLESKPSPTGRAQLVVRDNGTEMPRTGPPFSPRSAPPATETSMGLYLVHRIVEGHGGRLDVESVPGEGTTFRVTL